MRKTFIRFFTIADFEEEEAWLRSMHQEGWKLEDVTAPCFFHFVSCEPQDVIYRLDFKNNTQTEDYMQMLRDFGWEYFAHCVGWLYFRKPADAVETEDEGELFSDNASKAERISRIVRTRMLPLCVIFLCCLVPNFLNGIDNVGRMGTAFNVVFTILAVMIFLYIWLLVYCGVKLRRLRERYRS